MLFAGLGSVRTVKNYDRLQNATRGRTTSRQITYIDVKQLQPLSPMPTILG